VKVDGPEEIEPRGFNELNEEFLAVFDERTGR
jgi:hypothetical protein